MRQYNIESKHNLAYKMIYRYFMNVVEIWVDFYKQTISIFLFEEHL